jgi:hypothetical protein
VPRHLITFLVLILIIAGSSGAHAEGGAACFPACRSGFVCAPDGKCVSLCNPPCSGNEVCSAGECRATKSSTAASTAAATGDDKAEKTGKTEKTAASDAFSGEPLPERHYELGLALGYQRVGSLDYFAPALAFHYVLALGLEPHLLFGVRAGAALGTSTIGEVGLDLGYRHRLGAANAPLRGGFFITLRPELWPGASGASGTSRNAFVGGGSLGPFIELDRVLISLPFAGGAGKVLAHSGTFGYFSASAAAAVRF